MTSGRATAMRHPVAIYIALAFGISWGGVFLVVGPGGFPGTDAQFERLLLPVVLAMLAGPSVAGVLATGLVHGKAGLRDLLARACAWRVEVRWYGLALLTAPLAVAATLFALSILSPVFQPGIVTTDDPMSHLLFGLAVGVAAGIFEEIGWTGFAVPMLRTRHGLRTAGLIVGLLWGAWHLLVTWWGSAGSAGSVPMSIYLPVMLFSFLLPYRMLMVRVHERTGSLLLAMLMHASLTASVRILDPIAISGAPLLVYNLALGAVLWGVVALQRTAKGA